MLEHALASQFEKEKLIEIIPVILDSQGFRFLGHHKANVTFVPEGTGLELVFIHHGSICVVCSFMTTLTTFKITVASNGGYNSRCA